MDRIPLFPLDVVLFPGEVFGLHIFEDRYVMMAEEVLAEGLPIGIILAKRDEPPGRVEHEPERVGTAAKVIAHERIGDRYLLQTVGTRRFRVREVLSEKLYQEGIVEWLDEPEGDPQTARKLAEGLLEKVNALGAGVDWDDDAADDPVFVSHALGAALVLDLGTKQALLETKDAESRLRMEAAVIASAE